ncbi:MAG: hypothetical protein ABUL73_04225 [Alphaproteobacteria bacterium]
MASKLAFVDLGARGLDYVREHLLGANSFCTALLAAVEAAPGKVSTLAPEGVSVDRLYRFSEGGLHSASHARARVVRLEDGASLDQAGSLRVEQAAYLISMMQTTPDAVCIIDDFDPSWSEVQMLDDPDAFGVEDEVYRLFTSTEKPARIIRALGLSDTGWHGVAALCAEAPEIDDDRITSIEALQQSALSTFLITCIAYDGEGFVVWRRT